MFFKAALRTSTALALCVSATAAFAESHAPTITIATVNNGDMIRMQGYTDRFTEATGIAVEWVTLEENVLRQRVTTDITTKGGQFDIMTIGMYEAPIWGDLGWLEALEFGADYNVEDILPAMRGGLSSGGNLYAAPFYGESSMVMYRKDLVEAAGMSIRVALVARDPLLLLLLFPLLGGLRDLLVPPSGAHAEVVGHNNKEQIQHRQHEQHIEQPYPP